MNIVFDLTCIQEIATLLWEEGASYNIWAFHAPMGAGKTTLTSALCSGVLGVATNTISSPTFSIINQYKSTVVGTIFHMDWYRLKNEEEAVMAGVEVPLLSDHLCIVEWSENAVMLLPKPTFRVHLKILDTTTRSIYSCVDKK